MLLNINEFTASSCCSCSRNVSFKLAYFEDILVLTWYPGSRNCRVRNPSKVSQFTVSSRSSKGERPECILTKNAILTDGAEESAKDKTTIYCTSTVYNSTVPNCDEHNGRL